MLELSDCLGSTQHWHRRLPLRRLLVRLPQSHSPAEEQLEQKKLLGSAGQGVAASSWCQCRAVTFSILSVGLAGACQVNEQPFTGQGQA